MTPAEKIAEDTWHKLKEAQSLHVRLGEETLTDLLMLEMKRQEAAHSFRVDQTTKKEEASSGTDLLVVVREGTTADARLYAIQAKKLFRSGHYEALKKENNVQLDNLEEYAQQIGALPYFLFYNFVSDSRQYWHCGRNYDESQLGCTLVPSRVVRVALEMPPKFRPRTFQYLHGPQHALPWRCLFQCLHWESGLRGAWSDSDQIGGIAQRIPPYGWVNVDPVPGAWPTELAGSDDVDLAPILGRYVDERKLDHTAVNLLPEIRPRRFIFVDKSMG